jgi:hypothetical protein
MDCGMVENVLSVLMALRLSKQLKSPSHSPTFLLIFAAGAE